LAPKFCTKNAHVKCWWNWLKLSSATNKDIHKTQISKSVSHCKKTHLNSRIQGSISSTFYTKLFRVQISNAQQNKVKSSVLFALLGSGHVKAEHKMLMKSTPGVKFTNNYIRVAFCAKVFCAVFPHILTVCICIVEILLIGKNPAHIICKTNYSYSKEQSLCLTTISMIFNRDRLQGRIKEFWGPG